MQIRHVVGYSVIGPRSKPDSCKTKLSIIQHGSVTESKANIMSRVKVTLNGVLNWILDLYIYTRLGITDNYSAIANLHNSQITTAPSKSFQPVVASPTVPCKGY
jgi:hypothetical protein